MVSPSEQILGRLRFWRQLACNLINMGRLLPAEYLQREIAQYWGDYRQQCHTRVGPRGQRFRVSPSAPFITQEW